IYLVREAGTRPGAIGVIFAAGSVGFLIGAALADRVMRRLGLGRSIVVGGCIGAGAMLLIAVPPARAAPAFVAAGLFVYGLGALTSTPAGAAWPQLGVPPELRGRTPASMRFLIWVAHPVAGVLAGWLGSRLGLHPTLWVGAIGALFAPIALLTA